MSVDSYRALRELVLPHIFYVFGLPWTPGGDKANATVANNAFVGPEHSQLNVECTQAQADAVREHLVKLGFAEPQEPAGRSFQHHFLWGAVSTANLRRSRLRRQLRADGYELGEGWLLSGQRPLEDRDGDPMELLKGINPDVLNHPWVQQHIADRPWKDNWQITEFEVWTAIELALDPGTEVMLEVPALVDPALPGVPDRRLQEVLLQHPNREITVVCNAPAVERKGPPRHTTVSCTKELLRTHPDLLSSWQKVLYINGNPHANRMLEDSRRTLAGLGRHPHLEMAATALPPTHPRFVLNSLHELGQREHNEYLL